MSYRRNGDTVVLTLSIEQYEQLLMALGIACGGMRDQEWMYRTLALVNAINDGNPQFRAYEIPKEYRQ